jgi:uncharacterized protein (TIGR00369 family)
MQTIFPTSLLDRSRFDAHYGLELLECTPDVVRARVTVVDELKQPTGVVHGGVYAAIAEAVASGGTNTAVSGDGKVALGMHNATSFLRAVSSGAIHAVARPRHCGKTTWVWDVDMTDDQQRLCAVSRVTIAVRPAAGP